MTVHSEETNITRGWGRLALHVVNWLVSGAILAIAFEMYRAMPTDLPYLSAFEITFRMLIAGTAVWLWDACGKL
jgi:hypothetical protein